MEPIQDVPAGPKDPNPDALPPSSWRACEGLRSSTLKQTFIYRPIEDIDTPRLDGSRSPPWRTSQGVLSSRLVPTIVDNPNEIIDVLRLDDDGAHDKPHTGHGEQDPKQDNVGGQDKNGNHDSNNGQHSDTGKYSKTSENGKISENGKTSENSNTENSNTSENSDTWEHDNISEHGSDSEQDIVNPSDGYVIYSDRIIVPRAGHVAHPLPAQSGSYISPPHADQDPKQFVHSLGPSVPNPPTPPSPPVLPDLSVSPGPSPPPLPDPATPPLTPRSSRQGQPGEQAAVDGGGEGSARGELASRSSLGGVTVFGASSSVCRLDHRAKLFGGFVPAAAAAAPPRQVWRLSVMRHQKLGVGIVVQLFPLQPCPKPKRLPARMDMNRQEAQKDGPRTLNVI
ncbi:hypothetical protein F4802DRAFT_595932 [Xylaria palmicola]|nr:hypothetical protein F4802DRAFT_595932 [Xylaria palmicola]